MTAVGMLPSKWTIPYLLAAVAPLAISCAAPEDEAEIECDEDGKCDEVKSTVCDGIMKDKSGANTKKTAGRRNDPLAKAVWHEGDSCPTTFSEVMDKLRANDKEGCEGERDGIETRVISETAQAQGKATTYRTVTTRTCGDRDTNGIMFSLFGISAGASRLPEAFEVIAFDETAGIYNFYESDGRELHFFGNSNDMLKGPGSNDNRRCASCHPAGGLVMKELDTPWLHWEGHMDIPGAEDLVEKHKNLGTKNTGAELEFVVKSGNDKWNKTRLETLKKSGKVDQLLKPLFCSVEVNLDNGADFESPVMGGPGGDEMSRVPFDSLLDPQLKSFGSISIQFADYDALIKEKGQTLPGVPGAIDTVFDYVFVERSHIDNDYVEKLVEAGIVDADFVKDVLMVDFTRPVFSSDRCGLLSFAPQLAADDLTAAKIKKGFIDALEAESPAAGSPAAVLLKNLETANDGSAHDDKVDAFIAACTALGSRPFLENALAVNSLVRKTAREMPIMEFEATMPTDRQVVDPDARLHPATCALVNSFVAP
jgi:hypothetical protein